MRSLRILAAAAFVAAAAPAFAQGPAQDPAKADDGATASPAQQRAIDESYRGRCEAKVPRELCACVIAVADSQIADPTERQIFYDFMMGDVDKAKASRAAFAPEKNMRFNIALQKADVMLGDRCDKLKPKEPEAPEGKAPAGPAGK
ncbi:hypothetical protein IHQ68_03760 [Chelatococcus sambhunathii]|uniref:Uncharacterized protein n=1 Tax=Chelatococcus sambhunathii TaxID=363953 RepID=A0ABU1DCB2_9HYPH|nr:hypothetical protein [Chelatococcus sambhunathii]MDR4305739.1 hypothetical protein [Chelatococcus sambhunathii]